MKKINDESNDKQNFCTPKFKCSIPYGSPECEHFDAMHTGDCRHFIPRTHQTCFSEKARDAALDKVVEFVRKANTDDGFMAG